MGTILSTPDPHGRLPLALDHLVVAARSLDEGEAWLTARLGRPLSAGGTHPGFGTHNRLLSLGPDCYLELIARDPLQPRASRVMFGLDQPAVVASIAEAPRLLHLVMRVLPPADLSMILPRLAYDPGTPMRMTRGALGWDITITEDCRPRAGGLLPTIIDWGRSAHPAAQLPDSGIRLEWLELAGPANLIAKFPTPALALNITLTIASAGSICAAFLLNDKRVIIKSPLPFSNLGASSQPALN